MESLVTLGRYVSNLIRFGKPYAPEQLAQKCVCRKTVLKDIPCLKWAPLAFNLFFIL